MQVRYQAALRSDGANYSVAAGPAQLSSGSARTSGADRHAEAQAAQEGQEHTIPFQENRLSTIMVDGGLIRSAGAR